MASHRKPRSRTPQSALSTRSALGLTTAALASVTLLSQSANAAPARPGDGDKPSLSEVQNRVDSLYRQAGSATQRYNAAKERTDKQRAHVDGLLDQVAHRTDKLNDARRVLGSFAAAQYRTGGISQTATLLLTKDPQTFFRQTHVLDRMTGRQKQAVDDFEKQQKEAARKRSEATSQLKSLSSSQKQLKSDKREIQSKLSEARTLLSKLTAEERPASPSRSARSGPRPVSGPRSGPRRSGASGSARTAAARAAAAGAVTPRPGRPRRAVPSRPRRRRSSPLRSSSWASRMCGAPRGPAPTTAPG